VSNMSDTVKFALPQKIEALQDAKRGLALDAILSLAEDFAGRPDFDRTVELTLLSVSGQLTTPDAFLYLAETRRLEDSSFAGSGRFKDNTPLQELITGSVFDHVAKPHIEIVHVATEMRRDSALARELHELDLEVLVPLKSQKTVYGVLGLGRKVTGKSHTQADLDLLQWLVRSVTPLLVNARMFADIDSLKSWYADLLNSIQQSVLVFDKQLRLKMMNVAALRLLESVRQGPIQTDDHRNLSFEEIFTPREFPNWVRPLRSLLTSGGGALGQTLRAVTPEDERAFNARIAFSTGAHSDSSDVILSLDDVTDQRKAEVRMFNLERKAERGTMASSIAHEMNNYLGMILAGVEMSQLHISKGNTDKAEGQLEKAREMVLHMKRFTDGLTDSNRLDARPTITNLSNVITDVLSFVQVQKRFRQLYIHSHLDRSLPEILMDKDQVSQLLLNFLNNAADAIAQAGRTEGRIKVSATATADSVVMAVEDNGTGIPAEIRDRLFRERLTTKEDGHGYGLVTCHKILKNHNAKITIDSTEGQGSTFSVSFPIPEQSR